MKTRYTLWILVFLAALLLAACGGRQDAGAAIDEALESLQLSDEDIRCAEEEYEEARRLLDEAREAQAARDFELARELADEAIAQAALARELSLQRGPDCDEEEEETRDTDDESDTFTRDPDEEIDWDAVDTESLGPVFFEFDSYSIDEEGRETLANHADWLREHSDKLLIIQGHTDARGSTEYNLALGERRARAVRDYLDRLGIDRQRMTVISFGKEMPVGSHDENRRADFIVR